MLISLMRPIRAFIVLVLLLAMATLATPGWATGVADDVQTSWRLLDYIAVDYRGAVTAGRVVNAAEYQEMTEFSGSVTKRLAKLPANPARAQLVSEAEALQAAVAARADPPAIAGHARKLAAG
ncbi:MAG: iron permease, partial [Sphingomonas sp.]|nr:iron permease [Sphingomonas sp.]